METRFNQFKTALYLFLTLQLPITVIAQENINTQFNRDTLLTAAKNMIEATSYCTLITLDTTGSPAARTMDPFSPEKSI
ncbi:MAG: hypothetical protein WB996_00040 [Ignavibacteriaceae bacterium]